MGSFKLGCGWIHWVPSARASVLRVAEYGLLLSILRIAYILLHVTYGTVFKTIRTCLPCVQLAIHTVTYLHT